MKKILISILVVSVIVLIGIVLTFIFSKDSFAQMGFIKDMFKIIGLVLSSMCTITIIICIIKLRSLK